MGPVVRLDSILDISDDAVDISVESEADVDVFAMDVVDVDELDICLEVGDGPVELTGDD